MLEECCHKVKLKHTYRFMQFILSMLILGTGAWISGGAVGHWEQVPESLGECLGLLGCVHSLQFTGFC